MENDTLNRSIRLLIYVLFFSSGATALVYEMAWARGLSLIFGSSIQAVSIVLASFMAGLALGGLYFGRRAAASHRPLRLYGLLECGIAISALLMPWLFGLINMLYVGIAQQIEGVNDTLNTCRIVMAFSVLVLPTFFMGGTLPILTQFLSHRYGDFGVRLALLYGINTVGAVAGTLAAGFVMLPALGMWKTQIAAVAVNALIAVVAIVMDNRLKRSQRETQRPAAAPPEDVSPSFTSSTPLSRDDTDAGLYWAYRLTFWGTAVSGLCALGLEVMWMRGISISSGTSVYSLTVMLATFLVGISLGSGLHALLPLRRIDENVQFGLALMVAGLSSVVVSQLIPRLPELAVQLNARIYGPVPTTGAQTTLLLSFVIMLVPCICMGMAFPLSGQARERLKRRSGRSVGETVALNTLGAILGSLLAGFLLIPWIGLQRGMLLLAGLYMAYGALVLFVTSTARHYPARRTLRIVSLVGAGMVVAIPLMADPWDTHLLGTFRNNHLFKYAMGRSKTDLNTRLSPVELLYYREGRGSTISVSASGMNRSLAVNGKTVASSALTDLHHELLLGHLPALLHHNPRSAIVIGLGAGITLGAVAAHDSIDKLTLVEIEPAVFGAASLFSDITDDVLNDPRLAIEYQDGRNYLLTTRETFDVITVDPIHPWAQGAGYLYTTEYYKLASDRLNDHGVMCQWLPLSGLSEANLKSIVASFSENFKYTTLWHAVFSAILIGSDSPLEVDMEDWTRRLANPKVARQLSRVGLAHPLVLLAEFCLDDRELRKYAADAEINTDDNLYIEFSSPLSVISQELLPNVRFFSSAAQSPLSIIQNPSDSFGSRRKAQEVLQSYVKAKAETVEATIKFSTGGVIALRTAAGNLKNLLGVRPDYAPARRLYCRAQTRIAWSERPKQALITCASAMKVCHDDPELHRVMGRKLLELRQVDRAIDQFREALRLYPSATAVHRDLASALAAAGQHEEAIRVLNQGLALYPRHFEMAFLLSWELATAPDPQLRNGNEALKYAKVLQRMRTERPVETLTLLAAAEAELGNMDQALGAARRALELCPPDGHSPMIKRIRRCLASFEAGQPYRQER